MKECFTSSLFGLITWRTSSAHYRRKQMKRALLLPATLSALLIASALSAGEIPCPPDPIVYHDDAEEYKTQRGGGIYSIRIQAPDADPGELVSCSMQIGNQALITIYDPQPLSCHEEDVSLLRGREVVDRWCNLAPDGDTDHPTTAVKLHTPGPKLF